ncbi:hypothetical protein [Vibrio sp. 10N.261.51.F12]|uniref:hypothetical protein n=1 Tax=Vibrio sp. 10N.261.51.F12 TaxID=3229679 RepID=UPI00354AE786
MTLFKRFYQLFIAIIITMCTHFVSADEYVTFEPSSLESSISFALEENSVLDEFSDSMTDEDGSVLNDSAGPLFLSVSRRAITDATQSVQGLIPDYYLLIAFLPPPLLKIATTATSMTSPQLHWTSRISSAPSRLSGWKDANTLYTHQHARFS